MLAHPLSVLSVLSVTASISCDPAPSHPPTPALLPPQESKRKAVSMLFRAAMLCHDEVRLQTVAPHLLALITQSEAKRGKAAGGAAEKLPAGVRALALRCLVRLVASVAVIPPSDAKVGRREWCRCLCLC